MMLVLTLLTPGLSQADEAEDAAVKAVENLGGAIVRDEKAIGKPVIAVHLSGDKVGPRVNDAELKVLAGLKDLRTLNLEYSKVTGWGLKDLVGLKNLVDLHLTYS